MVPTGGYACISVVIPRRRGATHLAEVETGNEKHSGASNSQEAGEELRKLEAPRRLWPPLPLVGEGVGCDAPAGSQPESNVVRHIAFLVTSATSIFLTRHDVIRTAANESLC